MNLKKLFRVDNSGRHALLDGTLPKWMDEEPDFDKHLAGENCLCVTPIGRDNTCYFGALDLDAKGDAPPIPHDLVQNLIKTHNMPLNLFYSKSKKGAHAYLFAKTPIPASEMRANLRLYAGIINTLLHEKHDIEIFPKQDTLGPDEDGNCIRIPYFGKTSQPVFPDDPITKDLIAVPPCLKESAQQGERNNYIYHMSVFLRYQGLEDVMGLITIINSSFDSPLPEDEIRKSNESGRRHFNRIHKKGFGLGCASCPSTKKNYCKFAGQQAVAEVNDMVNIAILHYISSDEKIKVTIEGKSIIFAPEDAFNHHKVTTSFILKHAITSLPEMKQPDWTRLLKELLKDADHVEAVDPADVGHYIINQLNKWSPKFRTGINKLYEGFPVFISAREVMIMPYDLYQYMSTQGVYGISREDVINTLNKIGVMVQVGGKPVIKIPTEALTLGGIPMVPPTLVDDVNPEELVFIEGETVKIMNALGVEISLTNDCLQRYPEVQQQIIENTTSGNIKVNF